MMEKVGDAHPTRLRKRYVMRTLPGYLASHHSASSAAPLYLVASTGKLIEPRFAKDGPPPVGHDREEVRCAGRG